MTGSVHSARPDFFEPVLGWRIWWRRDADLFDGTHAQARSAAAPDFVEPVTAWRVWRVVERRRRHLLASLYVNVAWPSRVPLEARCHQFFFHAPHAAPSAGCTCGIYAMPLEETLVGPLGRRLFPTVIGTLALWGEVVECEHGWRSRLAYPQRLFVVRIGKAPTERDERAVRGLAHYGVPVEALCAPRREAVLETLRRASGGSSGSDDGALGRAA